MPEISFKEFTYLSADGRTTVHAYIWAPVDVPPVAVVQLSHGMCEYVQRYDEWARRFAARGIVFCGNDHLGHGHTAPDEDELGFTDPDHGAVYLMEDLHTMTALMRKRYENLPIFLYGHSMGSFAARYYVTQYGEELAGVLISGTAGPGQPAGAGKAMAAHLGKRLGYHHRSKFLTSLAFGSYNKRFGKEDDPDAWLTRDKAVREAYAKDPFCKYVFTTTGYHTLFTLLFIVSQKEWPEKVPKNLPIFLFSGDMDPVGNYGKGIKKLYKRLRASGCNVTMKLYKNGRHEMHNELNKDEVFEDIYAFLAQIPQPLAGGRRYEL